MKNIFKKSSIILLLIILSFIFVKLNIYANEKKNDKNKLNENISLSTMIFAKYSFLALNKGEKGNQNTFSINRAYIDLKGILDDGVGFRITTDAESNGDEYRKLFLKYTYGSYKAFDHALFKFGLIETHWISYICSFSKYRILGKTINGERSIQSSADLGFSLESGYKNKEDRIFGIFDYHISLVNGMGFKKFEEMNDDLKNFLIRVGATFLDNKKIRFGVATGYILDFNKGTDEDLDNEHIINGLMHFSMKDYFTFYIESVYGIYIKDKNNRNLDYKYGGLSGLLAYHLIKNKVDILASFEFFNPNIENNETKFYTLLTGFNYKVNKKSLWLIPNVKIKWEDSKNIENYGTDLSINFDMQTKF